MKFDMPKDQSSIIKVIGVGGGGGNAVNYMFNQGIKGVDFLVCNTDQQALDVSPVPNKVQLGSSLTDGRGAGSLPEIGKNAAIENIDDIKEILAKETKMVFVTAGMGGGTGTGAAPIIAAAAKEMEILTVGIVTMPFTWEGRKRREQAESGLEAMRQSVDTLLVINNDRLREMYGNLSLSNAFSHADDVLSTAAKGIAEVISVTGSINVDFNDVNTVMKGSGVAIMGQAVAEGEDRATKAVENALSSPLLNDNHIKGAKYVLLNIAYGDQEVLMDEITDITDYIQDEAGSTADVIWGHGYDDSLEDEISVTLIATGFNTSPDTGVVQEPKKKVMHLDEERPTMITSKIDSPTQSNEPESKEEDEDGEPYVVKKEERQIEEEQQNSFEFDLESHSEEKKSNTQREEQKEVKRYFLDEEEPEEEVSSQEDTSTEPTMKESTDLGDDEEEVERINPSAEKSEDTPEPKQQEKLAGERLARIKELSSRLKTPTGLNDLENEPAYKRRNVKFKNTPKSDESSVSRFSLGEDKDEDGDKRSGLRPDNPYLHDNVD